MRRILTGLVVLGGAGIAAAAEPADLARQLGSPRFAEREAAARALLKFGGEALPAVRDAIETTADPAIRERAESLLPRLQRIADSERVLAPQLVKFDYRALPLAVVVEDLKKQTGIPLVFAENGVANKMRPVTMAGELPAWQAIEKLCEVAGLKEDHRAEYPLPQGTQSQPQFYSGNRFGYINGAGVQPFYTPSTAPVLLMDGKAEPLPGSRSASIRVLALPGAFEANRVVRGAGTVVLNLDVAPLPRLNWSGSTRVRVIQAEDEDGRPLFTDEKAVPDMIAPSPYGNFAWRGGGMWIEETTFSNVAIPGAGHNPRLTPVSLRTDDRAIKKLRKFEGVVVGDILKPNEPIIEIDQIGKRLGQSFEGPHGIKLSVIDFQSNTSRGITVKIRAEMPQYWATQGRRGRLSAEDLNIGNLQNKLRFYDDSGNACKNPQQRSASYSGSNWSQTYTADLYFPPSSPKGSGTGPPAKVVLLGTKLTTIEVPFAMENVRLP